MDLAEIGIPCIEQAFQFDASSGASLAQTTIDGGCTSEFDSTNCDACADIDKNVLGLGNPVYISP